MFFNDNMVSNKTNAKTITTLSSSQANVTSDLIDMDEMLDQLEREESEHETENQKNRLSIESDENFHKIEDNNFAEPLIEIDGEIVFCDAEIEQKVNICGVISEILPEVSTTSITKTIQNFSRDENKIEKEDYEDIEDIYNQIDEMDKLIKLEEEETFSFNLNEVTLKMTKNCEEKEENITMECIEVEENEINSMDFNEQNNGIEDQKCKDVNYNNESEFFDKFVTNLVDELFDQAFTELITSKNIDVETKDNKEENVCVESNSEQCFELNKEMNKKLEDESKELKEKLPPPLATYLTKSRGEFKLTESELTLGKKKPFWIPDIDCNACMLCSQRFSLVNRRHHCRACGRVLCRSCCSNRRLLDYMKEENPSNKQRVCTPCNRTLDRIEEYEKRLAENTEDFCGPSTSSYAQQSSNQLFVNNNDQINEGGENKNIFIKKSLLKPRRDSIDYYTTTNNQKNNELLKNKVENSQNEEEEEEKYLEELNEENKNNKEEINEELINNNNNFKKSVKFRDGVHPGQGNEINSSNPLRIIKTNDKNKNLQNPSTSNTSFEDKEINSEKQENIYSWLINKSNNEGINKQKEEINSNSSSSSHLHNQHGNKLPKKISRRTKERKIMEEQTSLLQIDHWRVCLISKDGEHLLFQKMDKIIFNLFSEKEEENKIINNNNCCPYSFVNIALRRNFHVKIEYWKNYKVNQKEIEILNFTTYGMSSIGVDELMIVLEFNKNIFCVQEQLELSLFNILEQFEQIFVDCLNSFDDLLDHRMGIRKCNNRIQRLYYLNKHLRILMGHTTEAIYFYRPQSLEKQLINLNFPSGPFLLGILVREEEIVWARCTPLRLLLRLGQISNQYPTPIINLLRDQPVFTKDIVQFSVLKVLNDFRGWTYQMTKIFNSTIIIKNNLTEIFLPKSSQDEIRTLIESNRNMVAWSLNELSFLENEMKIDSHLICEQKISEDGQQYFSTGIFKKEEEKEEEEDLPIKITCASFVIFDGALKSSGGINGGDKFVVNIVEDGLIIRLQSELMEELIKILLNNSDEDLTIFEAINKIQINEQEIKEQKLIVQYIEDNKQLNNSNNNYFGALISPIDGQQLGGQFQYGLQLQRQLISMNFFQYSTEWAIRLSTVINLMPGKWPSALQPRYFDVCEQLAKLVANTLEPFLPGLIAFNQLFIAMRINVDEENVSYETKHWESMLDQHFVWTVTLDDQIIPFLYSLCSWIPNNLRVELHMPILSIRSLPLTNIDLGENE